MADSESESKSGAQPEIPLAAPGATETHGDGTPAPVFSTEMNRRSPGFEKLYVAGRVLLYLFLGGAVAPPAVYTLAIHLFGRQRGSIGAEFLMFAEVVNFALIVGLTLLLAVAERTPWGSYGLPWKEAFRANFWVGMLLGLAEASVLIGMIELFGGFSLEGWALRGGAIFGWALLHFALFTFVGLYEEFLFRGYPQFALSKVMGFWPAAILLSAGFGLVHKWNPGETWVGVASVALVGVLFAFTLKRTGNLWYAVGLHAGFDWAQSFLYSVPDSGELLQGHLWDSSLHGPVWLTGGSVGPEGSVFCFLTMGLQFLVVLWLFPEKQTNAEAVVSADSDQAA